MKQTDRTKVWLKTFIAIILLGFILNFPGMPGVRPVRAQVAGMQTPAAGFNWESVVYEKAWTW